MGRKYQRGGPSTNPKTKKTQKEKSCHISLTEVFVLLLAYAICSIQVYQVVQLYFAYPTTIDIRLDPSPHVYLPGITVCSELSSTILVEELVKIKPELYDVFAGKTRTEISIMLKKHDMRTMLISSLHSLPISQQHQLTVKSDKFFRQCQVPTPLSSIHSKVRLY